MSAKTEAFLWAALAASLVVFTVFQVGALRGLFTNPHLGTLSA